MEDPRYSLGGETAEDAYNRLAAERTSVIDVARDMADLTIPSEFPPEGYKTGDKIGYNNQSIGAWCVNTLASTLMFMAFPPGRPMARFEPVEHRLRDEIEADPEFWSKIKLALARKEMEHRERAEATPLRSTYTGFLKQLIIAGNCCWQHTELEDPVYHRMDSYVVQRDARGHQLLVVLKETVAIQGMEPDLAEFVRGRLADKLKDQKEWEQTADIYTVCKLHNDGQKTWLYWQECEGEMIPGTEVETDYDDPPLYADWLIPAYGQNWGRGYCEQYRGDLYIVETGSSALNDGASVAALTLLFVKPGSRTSLKSIKEAENLSVISGSAEDVTAFRLEKGGDFQFVANNLEQTVRRLARAFLLQSAIVRDAERVTREEIARLGSELDRAMGGLYSDLAQRGQRHVVRRFIRLHEDTDKQLPRLPEGLIRIAVVTGMDAMGATTEEEQLVSLGTTVNAVFGPQAASETLNKTDFTRRLSATKGIRPEGLVKTADDIAAEREQQTQSAQQMALLDKATGPMAGQAARVIGDQLTAPQNQPAQA